MCRTKIAIFAIASLLVLAAASAQAGDRVELKDITCEQFLAMDADQQDNIVYWIDGAATVDSKKEVAAGEIEVGYDAFGRPVAEVMTACSADKKASLWSKIKAKF